MVRPDGLVPCLLSELLQEVGVAIGIAHQEVNRFRLPGHAFNGRGVNQRQRREPLVELLDAFEKEESFGVRLRLGEHSRQAGQARQREQAGPFPLPRQVRRRTHRREFLRAEVLRLVNQDRQAHTLGSRGLRHIPNQLAEVHFQAARICPSPGDVREVEAKRPGAIRAHRGLETRGRLQRT